MMSHKFSTLTFLIAVFGIGFNHAFRPDYTYMASTNSYYKFNREGASWTDARASCLLEGSLLFHPETEKEAREVFSVLGAPNGIHVHTGIFYIEELNNSMTVDGRPISQVFNNWRPGEPNSCPDKTCHCGAIGIFDMQLGVFKCDGTWPYICKHYQPTTEEALTIDAVKTIMANTSDELPTVMERQAEVAGANQVAALDRLTSNLTNAIEILASKHAAIIDWQAANQAAAIDRQTVHQAAATDRLTAHQDAMLEQMTTSLDRLAANQAASIDKLISNLAATMERQTAAITLHAANQTMAMQRQAFALEKLANSENNQRE